ncbi:hypothetical protein [Streptomyces anandii]|uniref:hypothetical protein n=1 Tax=Streptomyces anandii TaxID=285454 RepID=UPI001674184C|nr:hypothetical protein [Streptomyces anandii]
MGDLARRSDRQSFVEAPVCRACTGGVESQPVGVGTVALLQWLGDVSDGRQGAGRRLALRVLLVIGFRTTAAEFWRPHSKG